MQMDIAVVSVFLKKHKYFILIVAVLYYLFTCNYGHTAQVRAKPSFDISSAKANAPMPTDSRIKTFVYNPNEIFQVKFMVKYQSIIELQKDEEVELISFGDPDPWTIKVVGRRLFIKVSEAGVKTNMTIITDKRTYLMEIMSNDDDNDTDDRITYILRFFYPDINVDLPPSEAKVARIKLNDRVLASASGQALVKESPVFANIGNINTSYSYAGSENKLITPIVVFDDNKKTYFKFSNKLPSLPIVSYVARYDDGIEEVPLKLRKSGEYYYVDTVEDQFTLRSGQDLVCIFNEYSKEATTELASTVGGKR